MPNNPSALPPRLAASVATTVSLVSAPSTLPRVLLRAPRQSPRSWTTCTRRVLSYVSHSRASDCTTYRVIPCNSPPRLLVSTSNRSPGLTPLMQTGSLRWAVLMLASTPVLSRTLPRAPPLLTASSHTLGLHSSIWC